MGDTDGFTLVGQGHRNISDLLLIKIHPSAVRCYKEWTNSGAGSESRKASRRLVQWSREEVPMAGTAVDGLNQQVGDQTDGLSGRL